MSKAKTKVPKARNLHCLNAIINRPSAGSMSDQKKELNKNMCRELEPLPFEEDEMLEVCESPEEIDAIAQGKCSCPQSLWYLNILEDVLYCSKRFRNEALPGEIVDEVRRAVEYGRSK